MAEIRIEEKIVLKRKFDVQHLEDLLTKKEYEAFVNIFVKGYTQIGTAAIMGIHRSTVCKLVRSMSERIFAFGTNNLKVRFRNYLKQRNYKVKREWKNNPIQQTRHPLLFLTKKQVQLLMREESLQSQKD